MKLCSSKCSSWCSSISALLSMCVPVFQYLFRARAEKEVTSVLYSSGKFIETLEHTGTLEHGGLGILS